MSVWYIYIGLYVVYCVCACSSKAGYTGIKKKHREALRD